MVFAIQKITKLHEVRYEVCAAVSVQVVFLWDVTPCSVICGRELLGTNFCLLYSGSGGTALQAGSSRLRFIVIFYSRNPFGHTMALGLTQPLTEISTGNV